MPDTKHHIAKLKHDHEMGARRAMMEELFNDYYKRRVSVYKMNFVRGLFFGLGTFLGGTIVVALLVWVLSWFVNIPWIGPTLQQAQDQIQQSQTHKE